MEGRDLFVSVLEQMPDGLIVLDNNDKVVFVNKAAEKISDIKKESILGVDVYQCHPEHEKEKLGKALDYLKNKKHEVRRIFHNETNNTTQENLYRAIFDEEGEFLGSLVMTRDISEKYDLDEKKLLLIDQMDDKIKDLRARFQNLFLSSLETLVNTLEAKDYYTKGHSMRVASLCERFLERESLMVPLKQNIIIAAKLHDIGKIGIKESILMKNDKLTAEENEQMQQHPIITAKILEPMDDLKDVVEIVKHHHERYDGTGYPDGLKGNAIPFGARLLALVDAFDAMTSARPYRGSLSFEEAVSQIRNNLGTQFDPQLGEKFLLHLELGDLDLPDFF